MLHTHTHTLISPKRLTCIVPRTTALHIIITVVIITIPTYTSNLMCGGGAGNRGSGLRCLRIRLFNRSGYDDGRSGI